MGSIPNLAKECSGFASRNLSRDLTASSYRPVAFRATALKYQALMKAGASSTDLFKATAASSYLP
jgi:hypothetical protein